MNDGDVGQCWCPLQKLPWLDSGVQFPWAESIINTCHIPCLFPIVEPSNALL